MQTLSASLEFLSKGVLGVGELVEIHNDAVWINNYVDFVVAVIQVEFDFGLSATLPLELGERRRRRRGRGSELDLVELGVVSDELFEVVDDEAVFGDGREVVGEEAGEAAAAAGGGGLLGAGVGLAVGAGALVEEGRVDLGSDEVMGGAEVECGER